MRKAGNFQEGHAGNEQALTAFARVGDRITRPGRNPLLILRKPDHHVGVQQNQYRSPHSSGEKAGETISPLILILPLKKPKISSFCFSTGTSFATGLPRLVIRTAWRLAWTSSMTFRQ